MGQVTKVLLLLALVVPVTAYVAGALASPGPPPVDHTPVILRDAPATTDPPTEAPEAPAPPAPERKGRQDDARVVTPLPTPVGEDEDDEWDDDGPDDDDRTDTDERDD